MSLVSRSHAKTASSTTNPRTGSSPSATPWAPPSYKPAATEKRKPPSARTSSNSSNNGWGLYGLHRALALQKKKAEAESVLKRFQTVWSRGDVKIQSACLCLPGV